MGFRQKKAADESSESDSSKGGSGDTTLPIASWYDLFSFLGTPRNELLFVFGCVAAALNGLVYPILAMLFSTSFSDLGGASDGMSEITSVALSFVYVGAFAFAVATLQSGCLEIAAAQAATNFSQQWFSAILRQDTAFFDAHDVSGLASMIGASSRKVRRGLGRKFGEGIQFGTCFVFGLAYAFYSSWRVSLVVLAVLPFVGVSGLAVMKINQSQTVRAGKAYSRAGSVAYSSVSAIRTVLSLNAVPEMIRQYCAATQDAYRSAVRPLLMQGFVNGSMLGTFVVLYCILTLYGSFLLYTDVGETGCDPSAGVLGNMTCGESGPGVFGAMLGAAFAAQGIQQVSAFIEAVTAARTAVASAMIPINRTMGSPATEIVVETGDQGDAKEEEKRKKKKKRMSIRGKSEHDDDADLETGSVHSKKAGPRTAMLPMYLIDSSSNTGLKPPIITGAISFRNVCFAYPTRPNNPIFNGFNLDIKAGSTVALVGPSGGGKSTTVGLIERFYDPSSGTIKIDGVNLKDINVSYLRGLLGYVGQEPTLFATSIAGNIRYGKQNATMEEVVAAAKMANAHDFIKSLPDGYDTQVGDNGSQLSGGQKQRIAIARVLVSNPKILILDEATSALDSESELVVQEALDKLLVQQKRTTIIIAHRLTTIRNADTIAVISNGQVVEKGSHRKLMNAPTGHYRNLVEKQEARSSSRSNSELDLAGKGRDSYLDLQSAGGNNPEASLLNFRDVTFSYPTRPKNLIMNGFNLSVRKGETLALVGPSGGGKSTTVSLVERFYDPVSGSLEYEGVDVRELNVKWLRDQIGMVQQEPTLFNTSIMKNISMGWPDATESDIVEAGKMANCHDFIMTLPEGYKTEVGERGTQLSGGQKQRIAIARALVKRPKILLLDEATSALDTDSERLVQEALDELMESRDRTTIVIAHRLSTIRNADRIAFVANGKVCEIGSHEELINKPRGRYRRLVESQKRSHNVDVQAIKNDSRGKANKNEMKDEDEAIKKELEENASKAFDPKLARKMALKDIFFLFWGSIGALLAGGVFPAWGIMFAKMIGLLFVRVQSCPLPDGSIPAAFDVSLSSMHFFDTCEDYKTFISDDMRTTSFMLGGWWAAVAAACFIGYTLVFWGFGTSTERMNKRIRDSAFGALIRQEVAFFDKQSVGGITSQLQDDAARIHTFTGEPIRTLLMSLSSVVIGITVSFVYMWPFALVSLATIPFMGFATSIEMKTMYGEDEGDDSKEGAADGLNSSGGIIVETFLNMRTVSALNLEKQRYRDYIAALKAEDHRPIATGIKSGMTSGLSMIIQQWSNALQFWWGGWLLFNYPNRFGFNDFLVSMFSLLFSLFALGAATMGASDKKECEKAAGRIFYLLQRPSLIDPLGIEGKKLK